MQTIHKIMRSMVTARAMSRAVLNNSMRASGHAVLGVLPLLASPNVVMITAEPFSESFKVLAVPLK